MSDAGTVVVELQATIIRGPSRPERFGWTVKIAAHETQEQTDAAVTDACRRLLTETKGKLL